MTRKEFDFTGFIAVEARNAMKVEIKRGETFSVAVEADEEAVPDVNVSVVGDKLVAKLEARWGHIGLLFKGASSPKLIVTMPSLSLIELAAGSRGNISGFSGIDMFKAELAGASKLTGEIACRKMQIYGAAASNFDLSGNADIADIELTAASGANLEKMAVGDAKLKLGGASTATINLSGRLDADVSGASNLKWLGAPSLGDVKITGGSSFSKK